VLAFCAVVLTSTGEWAAGQVQYWELALSWGGAGTGPGQFLSPRDVAVDEDGFVYVADEMNDRIQVFTQTGEFLREWRGSGWHTLDAPRSIAIDGDYAYTLSRYTLMKWTLAGEYVDGFSIYGAFGIQQSYGVAAKDGKVYVTALGVVLAFTSDLEFLGNFGDGVFWLDVEVADDGSVWCSASEEGFMRQYSPTGEVLAQWSTMLPGEDWTSPSGVSVTSSGTLLVVDVPQAWLGRFCEYRPDGTLLEVVYDSWNPYTWGIQAAGNDAVFVVSSNTELVFKYSRVVVPVEPSTWGGIKAMYSQ
jgi:DNA-binding beta-propeller fold protein YncE